jgi:WxcM-like, C-terminal
MQNRDVAEGVTMIAVDHRRDHRGQIAIFDADTMPFAPVRSFSIFNVPPGASRGGHALSCDEFLWLATGSCRISFANGTQTSSFKLDAGGQGVLVSAGVWIELNDFAPGTVVLGFAPVPFAQTRKFATPRPDLIAARTRM